ncbi:hypothetical protein AURDEDRAFT_177784 [Auricularia subglabra TFB-10046 SS5]|uniref:Uncharacterized protein n=1 Tax=Auricularia subglabra (strain TFB-10046 / SS5) TaxID=717982 RepID=J0CS91_AURST|nr:hypothetical protein AURDEDRAFT_177784 [Auricularia subglabra TFB-10046 SS5]
MGDPLVQAPEAWERVFCIAELRDMIFEAMACPATFCKFKAVSHDFSFLCDLSLQNLYQPYSLAAHFFADGRTAVLVAQNCRAIMAGSAVPEYMYGFTIKNTWLVIFVNRHMAVGVLDFVAKQGYVRYESKTLQDTARKHTCQLAIAVHRFTLDGKYVSVHIAVHEPIRLMIANTRPFALQGCDGFNFFDLYAQLGPAGPHPAMSHGRHAHLLREREVLAKLPPNTFTLLPNVLKHPSTSFIERWIGDGHTWIVPNTPGPALHRLTRLGWTVRLHAQRITPAHVLHIWTDTTARCVKHALLNGGYVGPPPAVAYATRVLDRMAMSLAPGVQLTGPAANIITEYDKELLSVFEHCFQAPTVPKVNKGQEAGEAAAP